MAPAMRLVGASGKMARPEGVEPTAVGFGDRCTAGCALGVSEIGTHHQGDARHSLAAFKGAARLSSRWQPARRTSDGARNQLRMERRSCLRIPRLCSRLSLCSLWKLVRWVRFERTNSARRTVLQTVGFSLSPTNAWKSFGMPQSVDESDQLVVIQHAQEEEMVLGERLAPPTFRVEGGHSSC